MSSYGTLPFWSASLGASLPLVGFSCASTTSLAIVKEGVKLTATSDAVGMVPLR